MPSPAPSPPAQTFPKIAPAQKRQYARFQAFLLARCRLKGPSGQPLELDGKTRNISEGGLLLLLPRALPEGVPLTVELDTQTGPAARSGRVAWVGKPERSDLGGTMIPHGIAFGEILERPFVEAVVTQRKPQDPRAPVEVQVDYATVVNGRSVNLSRSGVFIRTAHPLPVNQKLTLRVHLPGIPEPFHVQGQVIWSNPEAGKTYPQGMGVKFVDLPGSGRSSSGPSSRRSGGSGGWRRSRTCSGGPRPRRNDSGCRNRG